MHTLAFEINLPPFAVGLLVALFVLVSFMLMLIILIQRPQGGGLSEAFGTNSGSGHTAFGAKTGDALTTATIGIFVLFLLVSVFLNYVVRPLPAAAEEAAGSQPPASAPAAPGAPVPSPTGTISTTVTPPEGAPTGLTPGSAIPLELGPGGTLKEVVPTTAPSAPPTPVTPAAEQPKPETVPAAPAPAPAESPKPEEPAKPQ